MRTIQNRLGGGRWSKITETLFISVMKQYHMILEDFSELREFLLLQGFVVTCIEKRENGDTRFTLLNLDEMNGKLGETFYMTFEKIKPSPISEFLNTCEEVHAFGIGLLHSCKMLKPIAYASLKEYDNLSPELANDLENEYHYYLVGFWGLRIAVVIGIIWVTGSIETALHLLGW